MTTNLHDKMLAAIDALFSAYDSHEQYRAEEQLLDVRDEINKHKRAEQFCDNHCTWLDHHPDCDKCKAQQKDAARYQHIKGMARAMSLDINGNHYWTVALHGIRGPSLDEAIDRAIEAKLKEKNT